MSMKSLTKICSKCNMEKQIEDFINMKSSICKECQREYNRQYYYVHKSEITKKQKEYVKQHKEQIAQYQKQYVKLHKEQKAEYDKIYYKQNKEARLNYQKQYKERNQDKVKMWRELYKPVKNKNRQTNPKLRLDEAMGTAIWLSIKNNKAERPWEELVDYSLEDLIKHLELQFTPKMNWDNYGRNGWHIDHIIPKCQFNYTSPNDREFKICWSLMNLRPLWCTDNWSRNKSTCNDISNELKEKILSQYSNET